uniref:Uncharacterized protein n=1 Tax=Glossina brevipalpis TaxID=37001 RepID=A0A1A9WFG2_9MUSC
MANKRTTSIQTTNSYLTFSSVIIISITIPLHFKHVIGKLLIMDCFCRDDNSSLVTCFRRVLYLQFAIIEALSSFIEDHKMQEICETTLSVNTLKNMYASASIKT